jgi:hypothetical protein
VSFFSGNGQKCRQFFGNSEYVDFFADSIINEVSTIFFYLDIVHDFDVYHQAILFYQEDGNLKKQYTLGNFKITFVILWRLEKNKASEKIRTPKTLATTKKAIRAHCKTLSI